MQQGHAHALAGRTILITGATRGIGQATAEALARMGATIIVHGRDAGRVERACNALKQSALYAPVFGAVADLASLADVHRLADEIEQRHDRLDVLINNAGCVTRRRRETEDGLEWQLAVNHLAPFLLTHRLLDKLNAGAPARIVNVSSMAHHRAALDLDDLNWERRRYSGIGAYGATKLANILFTRELARRLDPTRVTVNCLHPGVVATNIFAGMGVVGALFGILSKPFMLASGKGAETSVFLAASEDAHGVNGRFFDKSKPVEPSLAALDDAAAAALWERSERLAGLG